MNEANFDMAVPYRPPGSILPAGQQWLAHRGAKQQRRYMRQRCAAAVRSKVPEVRAVIVRLAAVCDGGLQDPYAEMYPMICEAMHEAEQTAGWWVDIVNGQLDQFEEAQAEGEQ